MTWRQESLLLTPGEERRHRKHVAEIGDSGLSYIQRQGWAIVLSFPGDAQRSRK